VTHLLLLGRVAAGHHGDDGLGKTASSLGEGVFLVTADFAAEQHRGGLLVVGQCLKIFVRVAANDAVAAHVDDDALPDAGQRQLPCQGQCYGAATHDHRHAARLAKTRRNGAKEPASGHVKAERIRTDEPRSGSPRLRGRSERVVNRHVFGRRHDGGNARPRARRGGIADTLSRCVDQRNVRLLGHVGDAIVERQAVYGRPAAPERHSGNERRTSFDHPRNLVACIATSGRDHCCSPRLGIEERQPQEAGHALSSEGKCAR